MNHEDVLKLPCKVCGRALGDEPEYSWSLRGGAIHAMCDPPMSDEMFSDLEAFYKRELEKRNKA